MKLQEFVGKRIAELRKEKNRSQQDLANDANIERTHLTIIESGKKNISLSTLERIMIAMDITKEEFFNPEKNK